MIEVAPPQESLEIKKITRTSWLTQTVLSRGALPLILAFQALLSWSLLQNTAFQDEALYMYAGRQILQNWFGGQPLTDRYSSYFSGSAYLYPIIGGALDFLGGIEAARAFSTVCMLIVTICGYYVTKKLFTQKSAMFAALFFACQGPVLFLTRLATYDPLCVCLLAISAVVAINASMSRRPRGALALGPLLILTFAAKYAGLLFIPSILALLAVNTLFKHGWRSMLWRSSLTVISLVIVAILGFLVVNRFDPDMWHALGATTTNRTVLLSVGRKDLLLHVLQMAGIAYLVALSSLFFMRKNHFLLILLLFGSALLAPAYHIYKGELVSLDKHLGFAMFFMMPLVGYTLASISDFRWNFSPGRYWLAGIAACLVLFMIGTREAQDMYSTWASTNDLAYIFDTQARSGNGRYLAEQFETTRYDLRKNTYNWQWTGLDFFEYHDSQGHYYAGNDAYAKAIQDGYFDLVQLNYGIDVPTGQLITRSLTQNKKYVLVAKIPYHDYYGDGYFWLWRKR